jgi:hypothetical protein
MVNPPVKSLMRGRMRSMGSSSRVWQSWAVGYFSQNVGSALGVPPVAT